ncbi:mdm2-binding protein isoform X3 [Seriola lalandi dorsalis]|uniref:mdm2-binding protein isoform X3 n=1 Tax=Seriola lalandi dorsalis TaxID=1841481 RepID=UPI000C6F7937|nr:mdm2-binding protein isoform X3 [Seriola lalandi dorsalis]
MDRYVLVISCCQTDDDVAEDDTCLEPVKRIYDRLVDISTQESVGISVFPACSLNGSPSAQRWYFAVQACQGITQFCSPDWEELGAGHQKPDSEEAKPTAVESCLSSLSNQEALDQKDDQPTLTELLEEAAEGLHLLSDKLPPPGKALLDVLVLGSAEQPPPIKDLLPLLGALKHMSCWHGAKINVVTQHMTGWQKAASYLSAGLVEPGDLDSCVDHRELWRGGLVIRERKYVSELRFDGFSLRSPVHHISGSSLLQASYTTTDHKLQSEVCHYYTPVLDLVQLVNLLDLPSFLMSSTHFELGLCGKSAKAKLLLDQLRSLRGEVGALFSLSCIVTPIAQPTASQLSSQRWRESIARRPKSLPAPDVEVKGESAHYFLLVQGSDDVGCGACRVRMLHSDSQINGAAAMATVTRLLKEKSLSSSAGAVGDIFRPLPCLQGDSLLKRERKVTQVQTLVLKEYLRQKEEASASTSIPVNDLKVILSLAREQYLKMIDSTLPSADTCLTHEQETARASGFQTIFQQPSDWPERSVLHNIENLQRRRQKRRFGLLGPGSSDSLLGPKDGQKGSSALLDAKELLKHFTSDGLPTAELQPLTINRGNNVFQLSPDLSPRRVSQMPFNKASASHYHGIDFCLDNQRSLDRDQAFVRLQSRLIRHETQTTCSKEPCALPFALSPAPSPAVMSEPGSVPDGETLQNADVARLKRRSWDTDIIGGYPRKRLVKSESSDSLCSQSSGSSGTHPAIRSLRQQPSRSQSTSASIGSSSSLATRRTSSGLVTIPSADKPKPQQQKTHHVQTEDKPTKESRSQKHNRMLQEVVVKALKHHGITAEHECFEACSKRLFDISKFYLKDLRTSRGLHDEMKKAASSNVKQVIDWVLEKTSEK